ncbi:MAG: hypothetical protein ACI4AQ_07185 [Lachnospiraceae bacterium]
MHNNSSIQKEVLEYLELGIGVTLNGKEIQSCDKGIYALKENTLYMRDYLLNKEGDLEKINFTQIKKK